MKQQMANMSKRLCPAVAQKVTLVRPVFNNYNTEYSATLNYSSLEKSPNYGVNFPITVIPSTTLVVAAGWCGDIYHFGPNHLLLY